MIGVKNLSPSQFLEGISDNPDCVLLDVRTETEFKVKRIPGAINIDILSPEFHRRIVEMDTNKCYYLYCRSGSRSFHAGLLMAQKGFSKVFNLDCGLAGWKYSVEKG
ncbi:MAG: Sulfurtransferase [Ignavibacteriaceae bacterium]|nr:Sulfurtransferase [Ignavibacteriaceae bacterium]